MRQIIAILIFSLLMACNSDSKKAPQNPEEKPIKTAPINIKKPSSKTTSKGTHLCKINGEDWAYTKASGIVSTDRKSKKRIAIFTFKRKLEKGSESVQLYYDAASSELFKASIQLKFKSKESKLFTCFYEISPEVKSRHPESSMSGKIDLSNLSAASGTAAVSNINIRFEKGKLLDSKDASITLKDLKFSGVGYSDIDKVSKAFKK